MMKQKSEPVINVENITKYYTNTEEKNDNEQKVLILDDINLTVYSGEFVVIRGESGSGKTTLLSILGLIDNKYQGKYSLSDLTIKSDEKIVSWSIQEEVRAKKIGFIFQEARLFKYLNVKDNIFLPMRVHNVKDKARISLYKEFVEKMFTSNVNETSKTENCKQLLKRYPTTLSGGEEQRASILRSLAHDPIFILADEPTANLDKKRKKEIFELFKELSYSGKTIIVVSHDEVFLDAPVVYELQDGKLNVIKAPNTEEIEKKISNKHTYFDQKNLPDPVLSKKKIWSGLKPRSNLFLHFRLVRNDLVRNILFTVLIVGALLVASFQYTVLESLRSGTDLLLDEVIRKGSRLTRISIRPKNSFENDRFPDQDILSSIENVIHFVKRREGIYRINDWRGRVRKETTYGLKQNDPELDQLIFTAGKKFSSSAALEIIISERHIRRLFKIKEDIISDKIRNNIIGKFIDLSIARPSSGTTMNTAPDKIKFDIFKLQLTVVGIVARAEAGRNFYLPITTQLLMEKWRLENKFKIPYDLNKKEWTVIPRQLHQLSQFSYEEKAHIYVNDIQNVITVVKKLSSLGYSPEAKIFDYKWVLDTKKLAGWFLNGIVFIVAIIGVLIIFGNILTSVKMRKNEIILFKLIGMRDGDVSLMYILSSVLAAFIGTVSGFIAGSLVISMITVYIENNYPGTQFCNIFADPWQFYIQIACSGILLALLASVYPAYRAGRINPVEGFK